MLVEKFRKYFEIIYLGDQFIYAIFYKLETSTDFKNKLLSHDVLNGNLIGNYMFSSFHFVVKDPKNRLDYHLFMQIKRPIVWRMYLHTRKLSSQIARTASILHTLIGHYFNNFF
jgi:hypothetical protein